ncbi:dTDP-4-dehydrorhamnose 3,5-epimerase [Rhizobium sp. CFBP 8762]|uniref:dTDP-4-dehydrorhamnose 3,5-epimerase n=1 Tax=Rhizobium sp. CFBP 8762 TaxID=2775279 RepID=UPI001784C747|nr:dTDP-4-dehydrorhamnose 3,5-epimerase [Rhizobium sp. CFBP 8762]MBD8555134.1 dTDP-4-dehydrorhamnose 3,5-epimerase [Rhizobium sp. CFBP 8762]
MQFHNFDISNVILIIPKKTGDNRGYFMETFREELFQEQAGPVRFVQENRSFSAEAGTVRGLHFQLPPQAQGKLVSCIAGVLFDVAVDIRQSSPTYGQYISAELTADSGEQLWVPAGFAHGFCTLVPNTVISYKVTNYYSPEHDRGLLWNDPAIGIDWPVSIERVVLSDKDKRHPTLVDLPSSFVVAE